GACWWSATLPPRATQKWTSPTRGAWSCSGGWCLSMRCAPSRCPKTITSMCVVGGADAGCGGSIAPRRHGAQCSADAACVRRNDGGCALPLPRRLRWRHQPGQALSRHSTGWSGASHGPVPGTLHFRSTAHHVLQHFGVAWHYQSPKGTLIAQNDRDIWTFQARFPRDIAPEKIDAGAMLRDFAGHDFDCLPAHTHLEKNLAR